MNIKSILQNNSNATISSVSGYDTDTIHMLRKNKVHTHRITQMPNGKSIPTKGVLEQKIVEAFEKWNRGKKDRDAAFLQKMVPKYED